ncbi:MAG: hypothetical protein U0Y68_10670 [Blastocatellia bacterium]
MNYSKTRALANPASLPTACSKNQRLAASSVHLYCAGLDDVVAGVLPGDNFHLNRLPKIPQTFSCPASSLQREEFTHANQSNGATLGLFLAHAGGAGTNARCGRTCN